MITVTPANKLINQAQECFLCGNYAQAASCYEQLIDAELDIKSHYWYLGLMLLLQGEEVEAQTTWFMAMMEGEPEQVEAWNAELVEILQAEAERQEHLENYLCAKKIRENIREISPYNIKNILHLVQLSIELKTFEAEKLEDYKLIEILQQPKLEFPKELLMLVIGGILNEAYLHSSLTWDFLGACLVFFQENPQDLLTLLLPTALEIGYSRHRFKIAAKLCELYLQLSPQNTEVLGHLASFYQNIGEFDKGIETAKLLYFLVESLADKVFANRQILRGLMTPGGYWEECCYINQNHQKLLIELIAENNLQLGEDKTVKLFNANFFAPYIEDNPKNTKNIQNKIMQFCQANVNNYASGKIAEYSQGHLIRQKSAQIDKKLKIGYLSYCLRSHSVGWLSRWLLQYHDRERFQINGYFINNNLHNDSLHEWFVSQFDKSYKANFTHPIADQIYQDEIDILVDLDSITLDITCEIIALKPAPIQVSWLGWDASGSPSVDYFIADPYVLPESAQEYYREKIWRLPQTYIGVDGFEVGVPTVSREQLNIPSDAIVYFCGQRGYKRHGDIAQLQLGIIREVPNSYLLIKGLGNEETTKTFFYEIAEKEGVDPSKLRFLPIVPSEATHRANLDIADVVLDTYPYNGATTTLETLWMCIPMVTRVGEQFAARNSYTMMMNAGITEGIAWTDEEYVEWGIRLGKDETLRQQIVWKLRQSRKTAPLWNSKQFTREMEKAYVQMWQKYIDANQISS